MKIPKKIKFANLPTPIEKIKFGNHSFLMKRDDYTGTDLSGNKIRKLEYLIADAKKLKSDIIFTCGGSQSNHARATAAAAARSGLKTRLFLWGKERKNKNGNLFLDKMYGAETTYLDKKEFDNVNEIMFEERVKHLVKGKKVYVIPEGGSSTLGIWGYIDFMKELKDQKGGTKIKGIFAACGSGGTAAGMLVGAAYQNFDIDIYAVNVLRKKYEIEKRILDLAEGTKLDYDLNITINPEKLKIVDGYSREGYKNISVSKLKLIKRFARETGILLDPTYTGKAFSAYNNLVLKEENGKKVLFLHTGGIFGVFDKTPQYLTT